MIIQIVVLKITCEKCFSRYIFWGWKLLDLNEYLTYQENIEGLRILLLFIVHSRVGNL